jgi:uncharacterized protein (TIGR00369 family)
VTSEEELTARFGDRFDRELADAIVGRSFNDGGVPGYLGIRFTDMGPGWAVAELDVRPELHNPVGVAHGAVVASLVDHLLGSAVIALIPPRTWPATLEYKINYLNPAREGALVARAEVVSITKRTAVVRVECTNAGRPVASALGTIMLAAPRTEGEGPPRPPSART